MATVECAASHHDHTQTHGPPAECTWVTSQSANSQSPPPAGPHLSTGLCVTDRTNGISYIFTYITDIVLHNLYKNKNVTEFSRHSNSKKLVLVQKLLFFVNIC